MVDCLCNKDALKLIITSGGTLQLNYNRLEELPQHLCEVHSKLVRRIFAKRNLIKAIPDNLIYENVTELYLPSNRLTMLPDLSNLQSLQSLILADNNIDKLPTSIAMLANLTMLNLRNNCLESLPSEIGKLINLVVLDLSYNRLRKIPSSIKSCVALKKLWLTDNKLVTLPREICGMETLEEISVASNKNTLGFYSLVFLPPDLGRQENLFYMSLSENKYLNAIPFYLKGKLGSFYCSMQIKLVENTASHLGMQIHHLNELVTVFISNMFKLDQEPQDLRDICARVISMGKCCSDSELKDRLPENIYDVVTEPNGHCYICGKSLFWTMFVKCPESFTQVELNQQNMLHYLAYYCSLYCMNEGEIL